MEIVFENCEVMYVASAHVTYINIWGVTDSISYSHHNKETTTVKYAKGFNAGIKFDNYLVGRCLQYNDITQIVWEGETYFMNWKDYNLDENEYQSCHLDTKTNVLHINISEEDCEQ
jgi:hypothetical protein